MKKTIVIYYSNNGSNRFLAKKISENLNCEIEEIKPRLNVHLFLLLGINLGNKKVKANLSEYDMIILCGPIWMGKFIAPLKGFVNKYRKVINKLVFTSCCGSSLEMKDKKFGHGLVFKEIKDMLNEKCIHCEAFPIPLVLPEDKREDPNTVMKTRLTDDNFKGEILDKFNAFIQFLST
jgi:flavodoxin